MLVGLALGLIGGALSTVAVWINQHPVSWTQWSQCVVAHTLGAFVMTPLLLHTSTLRARLKDRAWCHELALFAAAAVLACSLLYARMAPVLSIGFVLGPVLGWGALRLRLDGAVLLNLIVAFNYGARQEIVEAVRALAREASRPCLGAKTKAARKIAVCSTTMTPPVAPSRK